MKAVLRRFGQILALVAMVASIVNAQCVFSCAVLPEKAKASEPSHACCPRQNPSELPEKTCPHSGAHHNQAAVTGDESLPVHVGSNMLPAPVPESFPLPTLSFSGALRAVQFPPGSDFRTSISILRI